MLPAARSPPPGHHRRRLAFDFARPGPDSRAARSRRGGGRDDGQQWRRGPVRSVEFGANTAVSWAEAGVHDPREAEQEREHEELAACAELAGLSVSVRDRRGPLHESVGPRLPRGLQRAREGAV